MFLQGKRCKFSFQEQFIVLAIKLQKKLSSKSQILKCFSIRQYWNIYKYLNIHNVPVSPNSSYFVVCGDVLLVSH